VGSATKPRASTQQQENRGGGGGGGSSAKILKKINFQENKKTSSFRFSLL